MLDEQKNDTISSAIQARLDDLFEETNPPAAIPDPEGNATYYPLSELKSLVLSIDWEITEEVLSDFLIQTDNLGILYKNDKVILKFLQILKALGKYIKARQSQAHPNAFKLLDSVFCGLEKIVITKNMSDLDKERQKEVSIFREPKLRQNNLIANTAESLDQKMVILSDKQLEDAINDIKHFIHSEIQGLTEKLVSNHNI